MKRLLNRYNLFLMITNTIENTIVNYLNNQATVAEMEVLEAWLADKNNEKLFLEYVKLNFLIDINTKSFDKVSLLEAVALEMKKDKKQKAPFKIQSLLRYAAIFVLLIGSVWIYSLLQNSNVNQSNTSINEVVLKSENGLVNILDQTGTSQIKNREGDVLFQKIDNSLSYSESQKTEGLVYNTLIVPYGRQFSIQLSDGTKVELNAGTSIKFPVKFLKGQERKVFIEYGEAFFDVAKDTEHPFIVNNYDVDIKVLGTQFNVSAYPEDESITTVLVEGSVKLIGQTNSNDKKESILQPGYKAVWSDGNKDFEINEADIEMQTGWRTGKIVLKSLAFKQMIIKLQRHYDVQIESNDEELNNEIITATFEEENMEDVLKLINEIHPITYQVEGRKVKIRKK